MTANQMTIDSPRSVGYAQAALIERPLVSAWIGLAVLSLTIGAVFAAVIVLGRVVGAHALPRLHIGFRPALVMHVTLVTLAWMGCLGAAIWRGQARAAQLRRSAAMPLAFIGLGLIAAAWMASAPPVLSNYVPILDHPCFLAGLACLLLAVAFEAFPAWRVVGARQPWRQAAGLGAIAYLVSLVVLGLTATRLFEAEPQAGLAALAERLFWPFGHSLQFVFVLITMTGWAWLGRQRLEGMRWVRVAIWSAALPALAVPVILLLGPVDAAATREQLTLLMQWGAWPGPLLMCLRTWHGLWRQRRVALRPGEAAMLASMALFIGGLVVGAAIRGNTLMVPAHYHGTVGAATLVGIALVLQTWRGADDRWAASCAAWPRGLMRADRWIVLGYAVGFVLLVSGLAIAGSLEVPRKALGLRAGNGQFMGAALVMGLGALLAIGAVLGLAVRGLPLAMDCARRWRQSRRSVPPARDRRLRRVVGTVLAVALAGAVIAPWIQAPSVVPQAEVPAPLAGPAREVNERFRRAS